MILRKVAASAALPSILFFLVAGEFAPAQTPSAAKPTSAAQPTASAAKPAASPAAAKAEESEKEAPAKPGKAAEQGIKVHGHWILQVKNADGTLGERREFDNSLVTSGTEVTGSQVMAGLLAGDFAAGDPTVTFVQSPLPPNSDATDYCQNIFCGYLTTIHTSAYVSGSGAATQAGLSAIVQFSPTVNWTLSGTYKIPSGLTSIGAVQVWLDFCLNKKFLHTNTPPCSPSSGPPTTAPPT